MKKTETNELEGIKFVVGTSGDKVAVLIDLKQHGELWEDFYDTIVARARADEPRESLDDVRKHISQAYR